MRNSARDIEREDVWHAFCLRRAACRTQGDFAALESDFAGFIDCDLAVVPKKPPRNVQPSTAGRTNHEQTYAVSR